MRKPKNESLKCVITVRRIPLDKYRLGTGRKWKAVAATRRTILMELATYANADGTFEREFELGKRNYSPSEKTLVESMGISRATIKRRTNDLRKTGLLDWTRDNHYDRRIYRIIFPEEQGSDSVKNDEKQGSDSPITGLILEAESQKQGSDSQEQGSQLVIPSVLTAFKNPPSTAKNTKKVGVVDFFIRKIEEATGRPLGIPLSAAQQNQLQDLDAQHGSKRIKRAVQRWCQTRNFQGLDQVANAFFREFDGCLEHVLSEEREERDNAEMILQIRAEGQREVAEQLAKLAEENVLAAETAGVI